MTTKWPRERTSLLCLNSMRNWSFGTSNGPCAPSTFSWSAGEFLGSCTRLVSENCWPQTHLKQCSDNKTPTRRRHQSEQLIQDARPDSYDYSCVSFLVSWTLTHESRVFLYIMQILEINQIAMLWSVTCISTSGFYIGGSPLQSSDWVALRKFIFRRRDYYSSVWATTDNRTDGGHSSKPKHTYSDSGHKYVNFL